MASSGCQLPESSPLEQVKKGTCGTASRKCSGHSISSAPATDLSWDGALCSVSSKLLDCSAIPFGIAHLELRTQIFQVNALHSSGPHGDFPALFQTLDVPGTRSLKPFLMGLVYTITILLSVEAGMGWASV
jgi:hypothetical protein